MFTVGVTEIRQNASAILKRVLETGKPAVILQRSKPVAYIIDASSYESILQKLEKAELLMRAAETKEALRRAARLREKMAQRGRQKDSVELIRELRESRER
ncbi:MAG: type II toxin-antitoxin system Phd/YefM family antitoxin [Moorellaceae bacterium]